MRMATPVGSSASHGGRRPAAGSLTVGAPALRRGQLNGRLVNAKGYCEAQEPNKKD
jgi:hypothetical protein